MKFFSLKQKGISIVEIIVAAGILGVVVIGIAGAIQIYLKIVYQNTRETQAVILLDETAEALQSLRDVSYSSNFGSIDEQEEYTLFWNGTEYELGTSPITFQYDMTRTITFESVERDGSDQIVESGGTNDENTKKAIITISWPYTDTVKTITSEVLIHNTYDN